MKKVLVLFFSACIPFLMTAQDTADNTHCIPFFPTNEGALLVSKSYNAKNKLLNTMIYRVNQSFQYDPGTSVEIGFTMTDSKNNVIDRGEIDAQCGVLNDFHLKMRNKSFSPEVMKILGTNTALIGNFLDYPNVFNDDYPYVSDIVMGESGFEIESKETNDYIKVHIYGRNYEKTEEITTPAGTFNAAKITFYFNVISNGEIRTYRGIEWVAIYAGIIRSETYDSKGKLLNYTLLTEYRDKE